MSVLVVILATFATLHDDKMAATNFKKIKPNVWIPPIYTANYKITVERSDGTVDDITDEIINLVVEDGVTEGIGTFEFELPNPNETYTTAWTGNEIFRYYKDYAPTATTLRFRGRIEKPSKIANNVKVTGRSESLFVVERTVTKKFSDTDTAVILLDLFNTYGDSRYTLTSIPATSGTQISVDWVDKPFWDAVIELCFASNYDCIIYPDLTVQFFAIGSINNETDAIVFDLNLFEVGDFAPDLQFVRNQVRVYGGVIEGSQIIYTANDTTSQTANGIRRRNISDDTITTFQQAVDLGNATLAEEKNPPQVGEIKAVLLATIQAGENIRISAPFDGLDLDFYRCLIWKDEISQDMLSTTVTINKQPKRISNVFKDRINRESRTQSTTSNPEDLDFAKTETYSTDVGTHSNTEIVNSVLKKAVAGSLGTWTSPSSETPDGNDVSSIVLLAAGTNTPGATFKVSLNGGDTFETVTLDTLTTLSSTVGSEIQVKIELDDDDTQISSYTIQFNTST